MSDREQRPLRGLKAEALTTEPLPALQIIFQPRFWGSFERRWELGKTHLAPQILRGWDTADHFLCGRPNSGEEQLGEDVKPGEPLPTSLCKKCRQVALKRGYGEEAR